MALEDKIKELQSASPKPVAVSSEVFFGKLFQSRDIAHIEHLKTTSFAAHKALNEYYDEIVDLVDSLIEAYQGIYGLTTISIPASTSQPNVVDYFTGLAQFIKTNRESIFKDSQLLNISDEILQLINSTVYKLRFLK